MASFSTLTLSVAALGAFAGLASAAPTAPSVPSIHEAGPLNTTIYRFSNIARTIMNQSAEDYDYVMMGYHEGTHQAMQAFASHVASGKRDEHSTMVAFVNATHGGHVTEVQENDFKFLCSALPEKMASTISDCQGLTVSPSTEEIPHSIEKRGLYTWSRQASHLATHNAVRALYFALNAALDKILPVAPRSWCQTSADDGTLACVSWSVDEPNLHLKDLLAVVQDSLAQEAWLNNMQNSFRAEKVMIEARTEVTAKVCMDTIVKKRLAGTTVCPVTNVCVSNSATSCT